MTTRTLTVLVTLTAALAAAFVAGGPTMAPAPARAQAKPIVWNLPTVAAPTYYHTVNYNAWAAKVKEKSQGRMEIRVHPASSLYPGPELIPAVLDGRSEVGTILASYLTDVLLEMGPLELPFMTSNIAEHKKAAMQLRPFYTEMLAKKGLKLLVHQHVAVAADLLHRAHPHRGRLAGQEDPSVRRRLRQCHAPARRIAGQHRLRRGVLRPREEDGGRGHDLRHQCRAHEVLRGREVPRLLVPRRRRPGVAGGEPEGVGRPAQGSPAGGARLHQGDEPRGEGVGGRRRRGGERRASGCPSWA